MWDCFRVLDIDAEVERRRSIEFCGPYKYNRLDDAFDRRDINEDGEEIDRLNRIYCEELKEKENKGKSKKETPIKIDEEEVPFTKDDMPY